MNACLSAFLYWMNLGTGRPKLEASLPLLTSERGSHFKQNEEIMQGLSCHQE